MSYRVGVQSYTYRNFDYEEIAEILSDTNIEAIEPCGVHIEPTESETAIDEFHETFETAGIDICGYGVTGIDRSTDVETLIDFATQLGVEYLSVDFDPEEVSPVMDLLEALDEMALTLAIHNHGPGHRYDSVRDVTAVLERIQNHRLGACVDTGHFLRSGEQPEDVIPVLGDRIHALHLKDFLDESTEVIPGDGQLDIGKLLELLDAASFDQPLVIEYEEDPEAPTPAVLETVDRVHRAGEVG